MRMIRNCNVCVIGGAGFLGSHLVNHLIEDRGCKVSVIDNLCAGKREFVHKDALFVYGDITKSEGWICKTFKHLGVQFVFNYAAWPYIPDSFSRPLHVFEVNATGAMNVINSAQEAGVEAILQVSSAEIYGDAKEFSMSKQSGAFRITESFEVRPHSTYGVAKAAIDYYVQARWREARTPCIALRQFNCVGERETHPYIVPEIISQLAKLRCIVCSGTGTKRRSTETGYEYDPCPACKGSKVAGGCVPTIHLGNNSFRDFLYAGDAVRIAVELLEQGQFGEVYNLGSETGIKMYDLAKLIGKLMDFADVVVEKDEARVRPWEIWHLQADVRKLKDTLYRVSSPQDDPANTRNLLWGATSLEEALRRTIKWYESNGRKWAWER